MKSNKLDDVEREIIREFKQYLRTIYYPKHIIVENLINKIDTADRKNKEIVTNTIKIKKEIEKIDAEINRINTINNNLKKTLLNM